MGLGTFTQQNAMALAMDKVDTSIEKHKKWETILAAGGRMDELSYMKRMIKPRLAKVFITLLAYRSS